MDGTVLLIGSAFLLRIWAEGLRSAPSPFKPLGWILACVSAWMIACALGAWSPVWIPLVLGLLGFSLAGAWRREVTLHGMEALTVGTTAFYSVPVLPLDMTMSAVVLSLCGSLLSIILMAKVKGAKVVTLTALPLLTLWWGYDHEYQLRSFRNFMAESNASVWNLTITPATYSQAVTLKTGAVAWLDHPANRRERKGALFFHGDNPYGANQSSAFVLRRALVDAGFTVLAVDHPGYGKSPKIKGERISAWDPTPTGISALRTLRMNGVDHVVVVGHSMGTGEVLRLLARDKTVDAACVFGGSAFDVSDEPFFYTKFFKHRQMDQPLPLDKFHEIRKSFYDPYVLAQRLPATHPPLWFVNFDRDHENITLSRDRLFNAIAGEKVKTEFYSDHYFASKRINPYFIGDARVTRSLSSFLRQELGLLPRQLDSKKTAPRPARREQGGGRTFAESMRIDG